MSFKGILGIGRFLFFCGLSLVGAGEATAQSSYPNRTITLILPFGAGTGTDATTRVIGQELNVVLGQPVVIENKSGGNGTIAAGQAAKAMPDGYTLFVGTNTTHSANPHLFKSIPYDPVKDFTPIARTGSFPFVLLISPGLEANTVQELIALAKKKPGELTYATGSATSIVAGATFARLAEIKLLNVPYRSPAQAIGDLLSDRISMIFLDLPTALPLLRGGKLRPLAVTTRGRAALFPDIPSMREAGVKDFELDSWQGYFGPAGLPDDIVMKLNASLRKVLENPKIRNQLAELGMGTDFSTPVELRDMIVRDQGVWGRLIKDAGIEPQ